MLYVIKMLRSKRTRNRPFFSIVACANNKNSFAFKEKLGFINPIEHTISLNSERISLLINQGAKISKKLYFRIKSMNKEIIWPESVIK